MLAALHSFVGLAAVFIGINSAMLPHIEMSSSQLTIHNIEVFIGVFIGAITFTGSVIAFLKLRGIMSGSPITFVAQHYLNLVLGISVIILIFYLCKTQSENLFWIIILISFILGVLLIIPIGVLICQ